MPLRQWEEIQEVLLEQQERKQLSRKPAKVIVMRNAVFATLILVSITGKVTAWNNKGHMVVAQLAYQRLSAEQRQSVLTVLKQHPHWNEYLITDRPENVPEEQWAFWRAATWADWVKHHHEQFSKPKWHYVDFPFVPPGSSERAENHEPRDENILIALPLCIEKARGASDQEKAIHLCWVMHLIGDLHQPLHCVSLYCEQFPTGDKGGNDSLYRLGSVALSSCTRSGTTCLAKA